MGLGKTLTMLSAVVCSKNAATQFAGITSKQTRATLIVVTSRRKFHFIMTLNTVLSLSYLDNVNKSDLRPELIDVWVSEIGK
jgi:hypothetical protein